MEIDYDKIANKIRDLVGDTPLYRFCQGTGVHVGNLSDFLNGKRKRSISLNTLYAISQKCNISLDYFFQDTVDVENFSDYALVNFYNVKVSAGYGEMPIDTEEKQLMPVNRKLLQRIGYEAKDLSVLQVSGDSMEPTLRDGDFVFMLNPSIILPFTSRIYVIRDAINGVKVKRLDTDKYGNLVVKSDNHHYEPLIYTKEEIENGLINIIGPVVGRITTA